MSANKKSVQPLMQHISVVSNQSKYLGNACVCSFSLDIVTANRLIKQHGISGNLCYARQIFEDMPQRNFISWNSMLAAYMNNGCPNDARQLFDKMPEKNGASWTIMIKGYARNAKIDEAQILFEKSAIKNLVCSTAMLSAFAQAGRLDEARKIFDEMPCRDVVTWNAMLQGYVQNGRMDIARHLFDVMPLRNVLSWTCMIDGYCREDNLDEARMIFDTMPCRNVVSWTAMITGYVRAARIDDACHLFDEMPVKDEHVCSIMISGFALAGRMEDAEKVFGNMKCTNIVANTAMVTGFAWNGYLKEARRLFSEIPQRNVVSWNALMAGYSQNGLYEEAVDLFVRMLREGTRADEASFVIVLSVCGNLALLDLGTMIHGFFCRSGFVNDISIENALLSMYAKCGSLEETQKVFGFMSSRNVVSWNSVISGYALHGFGEKAIELFEKMKKSEIRPDAITFVNVLTSCKHAGLVEKGRAYFDCMLRDPAIVPGPEHYACMVDVLCRAGCLDEAEKFIQSMPMEPSASVWGALLGACMSHGHVRLGEWAATEITRLQPENPTSFVGMSNLNASVGKQELAFSMKKMLQTKKIKKQPGCSRIMVNKVHAFLNGDIT